MNSHTPITATVSSDLSDVTEARLRKYHLHPLRVIWLLVVVLSLGIYIASVSARFNQMMAISKAHHAALVQLGLPDIFLAVYIIVLDLIVMLICLVIALVIFWHKSNDWSPLFFAFMIVVYGIWTTRPPETLVTLQPALLIAIQCLRALALQFILISGYIVPNGRFVPSWTRQLAIVFILLISVWLLFPRVPLNVIYMIYPQTQFSLLTLLVGAFLFATAVFAQVYRYIHVSTQVQRQQTKWIMFGAVVALLGLLVCELPAGVISSLQMPGIPSLLYIMISVPMLYCFTLLIPLSFGISILRYRLWDIDIIINRTLVYSGLSFSIIGIYVLVVGVFQTLLQLHSNLVISLIATSLIAVLFQPLRNHLQRGVNRMMYGERDDPYAVLSQLGRRLETTLVPETVLSVIVETVTQALKLPYAAIALKQDGIFEIAASCGSPRDDLLRLPLTYQSEIIGELLLVSRVPGEALTPADHRLLSDIAHQAGVAAHAVRLTTDLQRSREHLVTTREEERRRLRRDLHDGLGPTLSALTLKVGSARFLLTSNPAAADILLSELEGNIKSAVADIRRLVYDLRPPALDELGLVGAIREYAVECSELRRSGSDGDRILDITVDVPEFLPPLSAAVEVAVYRITQEALTNVIRHAHAQTCLIGLTLKNTLQLEITDDGVGLPTERRPGVGLTSMRERAMELGGTFLVETISTGGTRILACLPLLKVTQEDETPEKLL